MDNDQLKSKVSAKDFFINLGSIIALSVVVYNLIDLLFKVSEKAFRVSNSYGYVASSSISFPVATLIVFYPVYILLMFLIEKRYQQNPEKKNFSLRKWLEYITLLFLGSLIASDLVIFVYYFIDGQELSVLFLMKIFFALIIGLSSFSYYLYDTLGRLTMTLKKVWFGISLFIIVGSISWGFLILGSPLTQQFIKYDEQKISDLENLKGLVSSYWRINKHLPESLADIKNFSKPTVIPEDKQTNESYEYRKTNEVQYELCAKFNKDSDRAMLSPYMYEGVAWSHPAGRYCFMRATGAFLDSDFYSDKYFNNIDFR